MIKQKFFADVDVGFIGKNISISKITAAKEKLEKSTIPYKIDLVDFNHVDELFKEEVFTQKIRWLT